MIYSVLFAILIIAVHSCDRPYRVQCPDGTFSARDPNTCRFRVCGATQLKLPNGKCLDVHGPDYDSKRNGAKVQTWDCHPGPNQKFFYDPNQESFIVGYPTSNFCLDVHWDHFVQGQNGAYVQAWACHPGQNQRFKYTYYDNLKSANGDCMDLHGPDYNSRANGGRIQMWDCHPGPNQKFMPERRQCPDGSFSPLQGNRFRLCRPTELFLRNGKCLDIDGLHNNNWKRNGAKAQVWDCHRRTHSSNQKFIYDPNQKSFIVGFAQSNFCLDVHWGHFVQGQNGAYVQGWDCHPGQNQIFSYDREVHALTSANGDCMDLHGPDYTSRKNGGRIQMWDCHPGPNQDFLTRPGPAYAALSVEQNELGELGTDSSIFAFQLSNQWGIFAAVFGLLLVINIICMTYYWCNGCKKQKHKYDSVKFVDTEDEEMRT